VVPLRFEKLPEQEQVLRSRHFAERVASRRSVRHLSDRPVPFELIENAVRAAASAPSGANQQPWRFVAVGDSAVKREIRRAAEAEEFTKYTKRFPQDWLHAIRPFGTDWHRDFFEIAPWLIVVFRTVSGLGDIDTHAEPDGFLARLVELSANERPFLLIPVGYAADARVPAISRKPLDEVLVVR
jgi:iodotyrosine deiodinase